MEIKKIENARWLESGAIDCDVLFAEFDDFLSYTAIPDDTAETGRRVWEELQSGKWGEITPFTVTPEMLEIAKEEKRREIETWRTEQEVQPFTFEWNGHIWNAGPDSLARLSPLTVVIRSENSRETFIWNDANNQPVSLTIAQAEEFVAAMAQAQLDRNNEIYTRQREMKESLNEQSELQAVRNLEVL